jgi:hypothetical protein
MESKGRGEKLFRKFGGGSRGTDNGFERNCELVGGRVDLWF